MGIGNPCNHVATSQVGEFKYVAKHLPLELVSVPAIHSGLSPEHDPVARGEFLGDPAHRQSSFGASQASSKELALSSVQQKENV